MSNPHSAVVLYLEDRLQELRDSLTDHNISDCGREHIVHAISVLAELLDRQRSLEAAHERKPVQAAAIDSETEQQHASGRSARAV